MQNITAPPMQETATADWSTKYFPREEQQREKGFLGWWYHLSAPPSPPPTAPLREREIVRRGRLTSLVLLTFIIVAAVIGIPVRIIQDPVEAPFLIFLLVPLCLAVWFNRRGRINVSGSIIVTIVSAGLTAMLTVFQPKGLTVNSVVLYDFTILPVLMAVSLLPERIVFVAAGYNALFILTSFMLLPHAPDLQALIAQAHIAVLVRPLMLNLAVSVITYLWVRSATKAIKRADRAEVIATLEHDLAEQAQAIVRQKQQLDRSIQQIVHIHTCVANGDLSARVPLEQGNVLWEVAGALNNLLSRYQRARLSEHKVEEMQARLRWAHQMEYQLKEVQREHKRLAAEINKQLSTIRAAKYHHVPLTFKPTQTVIDPLVSELNGSYLVTSQ